MNAHRKMTPKGQMSSSGMGPAISLLPVQLKALFEPNAPLKHLSQLVKRKMPPYMGVQGFQDAFEREAPPERVILETPAERRERMRQEKLDAHDAKLKEAREKWNVNAVDEKKTEDAYKTLFVGRISYETTEKQLRQEFEHYGPVKRVRLVEDEEGKSRGYGFVEYENESDLKAAYKHADGKKIDGRRVVVDVERGRTVRDWQPRKFGGGIGETRKGGADVNVKYSGREPIGNVRIGRNAGGSGAVPRDYAPDRNTDRYRPSVRDDHPQHPPSSRDRSRERPRGGDRRERRRSRSRSGDRHDRDRGRGDRHRDRSRDRERRGSREYRDRRDR